MPSAVTDLDVQTTPDGDLEVHWTFDGPPVAVDVATGPTPNHVDHVHDRTVPPSQNSLVLRGPFPSRTFVSVAPHESGSAAVAADRHIAFDGSVNFRDLGGYRTADGGRVRWGRVFRADSLHDLTVDDLMRYEGLGIRAVYDLRNEAERAERPNKVPSLWRSLIGGTGGSPAPVPDELEMATTDHGERMLHGVYLGILDHAAPVIGSVISDLASAEGLPAVFHCHAGKDRTGIVAATLLVALGVNREQVLDDFELTNRYRREPTETDSWARLLDRGVAPEAAAAVLSAPRWAMADALEHLDNRHGGIDAWLTGPAGVHPEILAALRAELVQRPA